MARKGAFIPRLRLPPVRDPFRDRWFSSPGGDHEIGDAVKEISTNVGKPRRMRLTVRVLAAAGGAPAWIAVVGGAQGGGTGTAEAADTAALAAD
ncbi:hypothetical protein GCM10010377_23470 [Streptomyces viridiviolaceus]|uniref:Uncharacterized protein n=1 Tax=Streptomyces viridiviolaceus TaxID=68282 RepID=A0ABW2DTK0_9ACTN|nr:hypothetical protein [Streptomyces viridiviolaceus]GHB32424.1 hypothetical protein GCM10010377_23470 [Streptomyces viridiviolaceus]